MVTPNVAVILLSYNRPRMLTEALASIGPCAQLIVTDDGSDFDVRRLVRRFYPRAGFVTAPKMTLEERLVTPRLGRLINQALGQVTAPSVTYLCDDDVFAPGWLTAVQDFFWTHPAEHWVRGAWYQWQDGAARGVEPCPLDPRGLTTGNFAHQTACYSACGVRWNETSVACHDDMFLWDAHRFHNMFAVPHCGAVAGWRRLHPHNALGYTQHAQYNANARELFAGGFLE